MKPTPTKILVVDDDPGMLDTLSDVLSATGYETSIASLVPTVSIAAWTPSGARSRILSTSPSP